MHPHSHSAPGWLVPVALLSLLAAHLARPSSAVVSESRYKFWRPCTLAKELEDICQVKSLVGKNETEGSYKGLMMYFGETNCSVSIEQCRTDTCYSWRDLTAQLPTDPSIAMTTGFIRAIEVVSGASTFQLSREGFWFHASSDKVLIRYTTQTCAEFYTSHGGAGPQLCNQPIEAISGISTDTPNSLQCS